MAATNWPKLYHLVEIISRDYGILLSHEIGQLLNGVRWEVATHRQTILLINVYDHHLLHRITHKFTQFGIVLWFPHIITQAIQHYPRLQ